MLHGQSPIRLVMLERLQAFLRDESGATAIEYGLIAAGISIADHRGRERPWNETEDHIQFDLLSAKIRPKSRERWLSGLRHRTSVRYTGNTVSEVRILPLSANASPK